MGFEVRNNIDDNVLKFNFTGKDFETTTFRTESIDLSLPFGTIKGTQWFFDGIKMSYTQSVLNDPIDMDWTGDTEMINMHFNLKGKMKADELSIKTFLIQLSKKSFFNIANDDNDAIKRFADSVGSGKSASFSNSNLNIDLNLQNCINSILNCQYSEPLKRMYFFSKTIEILVLQAESFNRSTPQKSMYVKRDYDKERILFARDYLLKNIQHPPTLTELSRIAGINEYKLKKGFKETFNLSVFEYLSDVRLENAKNDLLEKKKSITEIAFELGYSSLQHFSSAFKKKFGVPPSKVS